MPANPAGVERKSPRATGRFDVVNNNGSVRAVRARLCARSDPPPEPPASGYVLSPTPMRLRAIAIDTQPCSFVGVAVASIREHEAKR
jgi:hypothetical protein